MDIEEKKKFVVKFFNLMGNRNLRSQALAMMAEDALWWIPGVGELNREQLAAGMAAADRCFLGNVIPTILGITAEGERVAFESVGGADIVNGERYENRYHCLVRFSGDRIAEVREYCDTKYAADMLGALLASETPQ